MAKQPKPPVIRDYTFPPNALIGEGAYGRVWIGLFKGDQPRAVKVFKPRSIQEALWQGEYEKLRALDEPPGIVTLYDRGNTDDEGLPYVSMRLMADRLPGESGWIGRTVSRALKSNKLSTPDRWRLVREVAEILAYMHRNDVRHCDIKPGNILLSSGEEPRAVICDFGQSRTEGFDEGEAMGTLLYASPEQLLSPDQPAKNWDVYSFGVAAYQILTGKLPRLQSLAEKRSGGPKSDAGMTLDETLIAQRQTGLPPEALASIDAVQIRDIPDLLTAQAEIETPPGLNAEQRDVFGVIERCLSLNARYPNMEKVVAAFEQAERRRALADARRKMLILAGLTAFGLLAASLAFWQGVRASSALVAAEQAATVAEAAQAKAEASFKAEAEARGRAEASGAEAIKQTKLAETAAAEAIASAELAQLHSSVAAGARRTAEALINDMLYDLNNDLKPLGRLDLLEQVAGRAEEYFDNLPDEHRDAASERERSTLLNNRGDVLLAQGRIDEALSAYENSVALRRALLAETPDDRDRQRDLSVSLERAGDARLAKQDLELAAQAYDESLRIRQGLNSGEQGSDASRSDLSVSFAKDGDVKLAAGDPAAALKAYEAAQQLLAGLAEADPENLDRQRDVCAGLARLGDCERANENGAAALAHYDNGIAKLRALSEGDPLNAQLLSDLSAILERRAKVHLKSDPLEAATTLSDSATILDELVLRDPQNVAWRASLARILDTLGDLRAEVDPVSARIHYRASLRAIQALITAGDRSENWRLTQVVTLYKMAGAARTAGSEIIAAEHYREALRALAELKTSGNLTDEQSKWIGIVDADLESL